jgi:hypothetical protein
VWDRLYINLIKYNGIFVKLLASRMDPTMHARSDIPEFLAWRNVGAKIPPTLGLLKIAQPQSHHSVVLHLGVLSKIPHACVAEPLGEYQFWSHQWGDGSAFDVISSMEVLLRRSFSFQQCRPCPSLLSIFVGGLWRSDCRRATYV